MICVYGVFKVYDNVSPLIRRQRIVQLCLMKDGISMREMLRSSQSSHYRAYTKCSQCIYVDIKV